MPAESKPPLISVVIVNFNGSEFLRQCLPAVFSQTYGAFEVIIVDNASDDGSVEYVRNHFPAVRLIPKQENLGFAGGTNAGIGEANGEFILTLNPDTIPSPDFIAELYKPMSRDPLTGMCASKMLLPSGRINSTGICVSRSGAAWDRGMDMPDQGQYDTGGEVFGPCGGAALYRRRMLDEIGGFDQDFFLYMEDVDLAFRGRLSGWKCAYVPGARVVHIHCGSTKEGSDLAVYYGNRNIIWVAIKNFPLMTLLTSLPWIIGRTIGVIPYYALRGQGIVILRAKYDGIKELPVLIRKRRQIQTGNDPVSSWIQAWAFHSC